MADTSGEGVVRREGFVPIEDYGVLGDGRTVALVASDGRVDWWPIPTIDAPPLCAAILDPASGGYFSLAPEGRFRVTRRYLPGTNVLEAVYETEGGSCRVVESLNSGLGGRLPWTELGRRVEGLVGRVDMAWELRPGNRFGRCQPSVTLHGATPVVTLENQTAGVIMSPESPATLGDDAISGWFTIGEGESHLVAVVATDHEPLFLPTCAQIDARIDRTIQSWVNWTSAMNYEGPWAGPVIRSALSLKTLLYEPGGAIAAAATTSLPERMGGDKNWDYRYSWVRDSSFTVDAFLNLGLNEEVHAAISWLLSALRRSEPDLHVFYSLDGEVTDGQSELPIPGYRKSTPVRDGNSASKQMQLGTYGDFFDTMFRYVEDGHLLDNETARLLCDLADQCCANWMKKDSGIWELEQLEHYTISKVGCWTALDRAVRLAGMDQLPSERAERWRVELGHIDSWIRTHCWSESQQSYTLHSATEELDAAVLLVGRNGFDRGPRLSTTIDAVAKCLGVEGSPLLYRYSGMESEEGAFVACTFWMVEALVWAGERDRAIALMERAVELANGLGILAEQVDPSDLSFLGNVPQGLSHLALITAAHAIAGSAPES